MAYRVKIKEFAEQQKLSRTKLSQRSEVTLKSIRKAWNEPVNAPIELESLDKIARVLGVRIEDLVESIPEGEQK